MKQCIVLGVFIFSLGMLSGCTRYAAPETPEEAVAQEKRMRYYLQETSPRNSSNLPKVTPEFRTTWGTPKKSAEGEVQNTQTPQQIEDEREHW